MSVDIVAAQANPIHPRTRHSSARSLMTATTAALAGFLFILFNEVIDIF
ncbi:MAG: hypothetical protein ABR590_11680 [Spirochaetia bacterium]